MRFTLASALAGLALTAQLALAVPHQPAGPEPHLARRGDHLELPRDLNESSTDEPLRMAKRASSAAKKKAAVAAAAAASKSKSLSLSKSKSRSLSLSKSKSRSKSASLSKSKSKATSLKKYSSSSKAKAAIKVKATTTKKTTTTKKAVAAATCAAPYTGGATTVSGTGTLPKPTTFVKRSGQKLTLNGKTFRIAGPNIYWLCQDENIPGVAKGTPTDKGRIREALAIAVAMGANTVRLMSCGVSVGGANSLSPSLGNYGNWDTADYVIYAAGQYGLRVVLPLTDQYDYYTGGKYTFLRWLSVSTGNNGAAFYTNQKVIDAFGNYIYALLTHVNPYNGKKWGQDPTILAWETGNELGAWQGQDGYPPASWTNAVAAQIKWLTQSLIIDGSSGFYNLANGDTAAGLNIGNIDIMSSHAYPRSLTEINKEIPLAAKANKNFLIGEWDWTNSGGTSLSSFLSKIESQPYMGSMMWSVFGHDAQCCNYVTHDDGYSLYYPNGGSSSLQANKLAVVKHWYKITGRAQPKTLPGVACPQPVF